MTLCHCWELVLVIFLLISGKVSSVSSTTGSRVDGNAMQQWVEQ